jgi:UDP-N-acetylglucosamine--N-acetylmuramyl-(pentapeptide) pyrophosphoryl-undecaprenol N-acetylglucosamine transferase
MKVMIACGGTGGHIIPGVSIAAELDSEVVFLVPRKGMDMVSCDCRAIPIISRPLVGGGIWRKVMFLLFVLPSVLQSLLILIREKPNVMVGTGGYASFLPVMLARALGIPTAIQEQNVAPGLTTRTLARAVNRVFVSYKETARWLPEKNLLVTGNPLRSEIGRVSRMDGLNHFGLNPNHPTILILGGSQGAHSMNRAFGEFLRLLPESTKIQSIVLTGKQDLNWVRRRAEAKPLRTLIFDFLTQIEYAYAASDLVVSRAGANTISELLLCGKPSILVPYQHAAGHQKLNALLLEKHGAAVIIEDQALSGEVLRDEIFGILNDRSRLQRMARSAERMARGDAAHVVAEEIVKCSGT